MSNTRKATGPAVPITEGVHRAHIHPRWLREVAKPGTCSWHGGYTPDGEPCYRRVNGRRCASHKTRRALHKGNDDR